MANNFKYRYRNKEFSYEEFVNGPGSKMSTDELQAILDKLSGATRTRRALQRAMTGQGYKLESANADGVVFKGEKGELSFDTFGEVEKYLIDKGVIKDEKAEAAKLAAQKKEKERARKEAAAKKAAEKKVADKAKAAAKKEAQKKKEAEKKAAAKEKADARKKAAKKTVVKKATAKKTTARGTVAKSIGGKATKSAAGAKKSTAVKKVGRPAKKAASSVKTMTRKSTSASGRGSVAAAKKTSARGRAKNAGMSKNLQETGFVVRIGRKEYTQRRLRDLALDTYIYDMGGDGKSAKDIAVYVKAEEKKCLFIINGKERGEFDL